MKTTMKNMKEIKSQVSIQVATVLKGKKLAPALLMGLVIWFVSPTPVCALVDDRQITISSATDVSNKRQALIQFIWGSAGFPSNKLPSSEYNNVCRLPAG